MLRLYHGIMRLIEDFRRSWRSRHSWRGGDMYISTRGLQQAELRADTDTRKREASVPIDVHVRRRRRG